MKSPFKLFKNDTEREKRFFSEIWKVCQKYGYDHYFLVAGEAIDEDNHTWTGNLQETWYEGTLNAVDEWVDILREKYGFERKDMERYDD